MTVDEMSVMPTDVDVEHVGEAGTPASSRRLQKRDERYGRMTPKGLALHTVWFEEGEPARIYAAGEGDLDLYVYDRFGQLVAHDNSALFTAACDWTPLGTGEYLVKLVNNDGLHMDYLLRVS